MKMPLQRFCPLCGRACRRAALCVHINSDSALICQATIGVIQSSHPTWVARDGACERCWTSYRRMSRVLIFPGGFSDRGFLAGCEASRIHSSDGHQTERNSGQHRLERIQQEIMVAGGGQG